MCELPTFGKFQFSVAEFFPTFGYWLPMVIPSCVFLPYTMSSLGTDDSEASHPLWGTLNSPPTFPALSVKTRSPFPRRQVFLLVTILLTITLCVLFWTSRMVPITRAGKPWQLKTSRPCERSILGKDLVTDEYGTCCPVHCAHVFLGFSWLGPQLNRAVGDLPAFFLCADPSPCLTLGLRS